VGFSGDPLGMRTTCRPLLEFATLVGLRRFRPAAQPGENRYTYVAWGEQLAPVLAAVAACGLLERPGWQTFEFRLLYRTKYLKSFLPAQRIGGPK
jgi:CRISPR-associated protein Csb3